MNISRYANIDKFVNIRYIFLLARRAYSWLFQLAQMWKLLAPGVGLGDFLTPTVSDIDKLVNIRISTYIHICYMLFNQQQWFIYSTASFLSKLRAKKVEKLCIFVIKQLQQMTAYRKFRKWNTGIGFRNLGIAFIFTYFPQFRSL
jgi:hypothetical protein